MLVNVFRLHCVNIVCLLIQTYRFDSVRLNHYFKIDLRSRIEHENTEHPTFDMSMYVDIRL